MSGNTSFIYVVTLHQCTTDHTSVDLFPGEAPLQTNG